MTLEGVGEILRRLTAQTQADAAQTDAVQTDSDEFFSPGASHVYLHLDETSGTVHRSGLAKRVPGTQ